MVLAHRNFVQDAHSAVQISNREKVDKIQKNIDTKASL